jgi:hypothetical protein
MFKALPLLATLVGLMMVPSLRAELSPAELEALELYVKPERLEEWNDWRFGLFIHWGP